MRIILSRRVASSAIALVVLVPAVPSVADPRAGATAEVRSRKCEWLSGDLHVHTTYSHDSYGGPTDDNTGPDEAYTLGWSVTEQAGIARSRGHDFIAITDHNDVRSASDAETKNITDLGLIPVPGYENSLPGHAQMLGTRTLLDNGQKTIHDVKRLANQMHAKGGLVQINHPSDLDWIKAYGGADVPVDEAIERAVDAFAPDALEVWNISAGIWQPPLPASNDDDFSLRFYDAFLDAGHRVAATGGSDNHWRSTTPAQGVGQPTTWVCAGERNATGVLDGIAEAHTTLSHQPPAHGGAFATMTADGDGDGEFESIIGDTVRSGSRVRVRVERASGATLRVVGTGSKTLLEEVVVGPESTHELTVPPGMRWARAEIFYDDAAARSVVCAAPNAPCFSRTGVVALTSPIYFDKEIVRNGSTYVVEQDGRIVVGNALIERTWGAGTASLVDKRSGRSLSAEDDLLVELADPVGGTDEIRLGAPTGYVAEPIARGLRLTLHFDTPVARVDRLIEIYDDIAGMQTQTIVTPRVPLAIGRAFQDILEIGPQARATVHAFRAGADWREPDWSGPAVGIGDKHAGTWRDTKTVEPGGSLDAPGQWLSASTPGAASSVFEVMERSDLPSSRANVAAGISSLGIDYSKDVVGAGPFEEDVHAENPGVASGRHREARAWEPFRLPRMFLGFGLDGTDENWQFFKYLRDRRMADYRHEVTFNSNGTDSNAISTGAKDDMNMATVAEVAPLARRLGVDTFILDDGWQAISGDWCPDSEQCPEPRRGTSPKFEPRFPDAMFEAVRDQIAPMKLGLWMSPMHFHPASTAYRTNPEWACHPVGDALVAYNTADGTSSSNEAGIGTWSIDAIPHVEDRIEHAIQEWGVEYFKFDFLVWLDCAGANDLWSYKEAFVGMLDRLHSRHPGVTFQIDETNDYRLFPFESVARGPSWFQNGSPEPDRSLHNVWNLSPYVPAFSLGQHFLGGKQWERYPVDTLMAAALPTHMTFFSDLRSVPGEVLDRAEEWTDFYRAHTEHFTQMTLPLLDDPVKKDWTALQIWDPERGIGSLLVFRQEGSDAARTVPLSMVPDGMTFELIEAPFGEVVGTATSDELRAGMTFQIPKNGAKVLLIRPAG